MGEYSQLIIGFAGMGGMGSRMAARLLEHGYPVHVYNRDPKKTEPLTRRGAVAALTPRDLAADCNVLMLSLADDSALESALLGPDGALDAAPAGRIIIDLSTVYPSTSRSIFDKARAKGISFLDAPVSGTLPQVEQGALLIMVGGEKRMFDECLPLLNVLGKSVIYMGESGSGATMKLIINTLLGISLEALAEAVALGERAGLPKEKMLDLLSQTTAVSPSQKAKIENVRRDEYPPFFPLRLMQKDFGLILRQAAELGVPMPAAAAAQQMAIAAMTAGYAEADFGAIVRFMEELSGARDKVGV
jgi:3-hydroxyisobutyrate dehydrogenase